MIYICKINHERQGFESVTHKLDASEDYDISEIAERASIINLHDLKMDANSFVSDDMDHDIVQVFHQEELLSTYKVDLGVVSRWVANAEQI